MALLGSLFSEFCPSVCLQLVIYLRRCLNPPSLVGDPLVFLLLCILRMESLLADAQSASKLVRPDLQLSGWKSNEKTSNWEPSQLGE